MKNYQRLLGYLTLLLSGFVVVGFSHDGDHRKLQSHSAGFAVVELFTSEGCSSCPAAEELAIKFAGEVNDNVYMLSYHVDYWDRLGWKDHFSEASYTERQKTYAAAFGLKSLYTPQFVVNGKTEFTGSNEIKLRSSVQHELKTETPQQLQLDATLSDVSTVVASCRINKSDHSVLHVALVQKQAETAVTRGENQGRKLQHLNIVRDLKTLAVKESAYENIRFKIPAGLIVKDLKVIAFLQDATSLRITAAATKNF